MILLSQLVYDFAKHLKSLLSSFIVFQFVSRLKTTRSKCSFPEAWIRSVPCSIHMITINRLPVVLLLWRSMTKTLTDALFVHRENVM